MPYCKEIAFGGSEYDASVALRYAVLREPLHLVFDPRDLAKEYMDHHLCIFAEDHTLTGCVVMTPINFVEVKMRQLAVHPAWQSKGIGTQLVIHAEEWAQDMSYRKIILNARKTAVPFYQNLHYNIEGEEFTEVGIPHFFMWKEM